MDAEKRNRGQDLAAALYVDAQLSMRAWATNEFLEVLEHQARLARRADESTRLAVELARDMGFAWSYIGELLGVSRQAAAQRFGPSAGSTSPGLQGLEELPIDEEDDSDSR